MANSLQYRLNVDIGHLLVEAMHEGLSASEAAETLRHCLQIAERNIAFGMDRPPERYRSLHHDAARYQWLRRLNDEGLDARIDELRRLER